MRDGPDSFGRPPTRDVKKGRCPRSVSLPETKGPSVWIPGDVTDDPLEGRGRDRDIPTPTTKRQRV